MRLQIQFQIVVITLLLALTLGVSMDAFGQHKTSVVGHGGHVVSAAGLQHHRHGPPAHRGPSHHQSRTVLRRASRATHASPKARKADWYARTAVSQSHTAWRFGCAHSHPRWSTSYQDHYQWAYGQSLHRAQREIERRERTLARCLAW